MPGADTPNILLIVADHHPMGWTGYAGHPHLRTPNLDAIAARGTQFSQAYCNSPVCGPSRSCYMTGRYNHELGHWVNGVPLPHSLRTWARELTDAGWDTALFGKIDFSGSEEMERAGFRDVIFSARRRVMPTYPATEPNAWIAPGFRRALSRQLLDEAGPREALGHLPSDSKLGVDMGHHGLYDYDRDVTDNALSYIRDHADGDTPWAMHVGYLFPHWPFLVPPRYYEQYYPHAVDLPHNPRFPNPDLPPAIHEFQQWNDFGELDDETILRTRATFSGMITAVDDMVGELVAALQASGQLENTVIIYTSDHGDSMGENGLFYKLSPLEPSIGVPLVMAGPGVPADHRVDAPVSLLDLYRTVHQIAEIEPDPTTHGRSWIDVANAEYATPEPVFSEYHGVGFRGAWYLLRDGDYKYTWYEYYPATLHHIPSDPYEQHDLAADPAQAERLAAFERQLRAICDPHAESDRCKRDLGLITPDGVDLTADKAAYGYA